SIVKRTTNRASSRATKATMPPSIGLTQRGVGGAVRLLPAGNALLVSLHHAGGVPASIEAAGGGELWGKTSGRSIRTEGTLTMGLGPSGHSVVWVLSRCAFSALLGRRGDRDHHPTDAP